MNSCSCGATDPCVACKGIASLQEEYERQRVLVAIERQAVDDTLNRFAEEHPELADVVARTRALYGQSKLLRL